jgi:hypothetical protein
MVAGVTAGRVKGQVHVGDRRRVGTERMDGDIGIGDDIDAARRQGRFDRLIGACRERLSERRRECDRVKTPARVRLEAVCECSIEHCPESGRTSEMAVAGRATSATMAAARWRMRSGSWRRARSVVANAATLIPPTFGAEI